MHGSGQVEESRDDPGSGDPVIATCIAVAVAAGGWVATESTSGVLRIVCGLVTVVAAACAVYLLGVLVMWFALSRAIDNIDRVRTESFRDRIPWFLWCVVPLLIVGWAMQAWLYGYDASQWLWTGVSVAAGSVAIVVAFVRTRRAPVPDGPDGPRHRRRPSR